MSKSTSKSCFLLLSLGLALLTMSTATPASAHALDMATARVSLRDAHVEIVVEADLLALIGRSSIGAPDPTAIAVASEAELTTYMMAAKAELVRGAQLLADGVAVPLAISAFPVPPQVRMLAAQVAASPNDHAGFLPIRLEATRPVIGARSLTVTMPRAMGPVLFSYVQPKTAFAFEGTPATFAVLSSNAVTASPDAMPSRHLGGILAGALLLCAAALYFSLLRTRSEGTGRSLKRFAARTLAVFGISSLLGGCGPAESDATGNLALKSSAFADGGVLPAAYTCDGIKHSPPLSWSGAPAATVEYALLMTTLANDGLKWNWVLYHVGKDTTSLAENTQGVGTFGVTSDGPALAYSPPCSQGPGAKSYTFTLYALSGVPAFSTSPVTGKLVTDAISAMTLASSKLTVTYTR